MPDTLTTKEAAAFLGKSVFTMRSMRRRGKGPPYHVDPNTADTPERRLIHYNRDDLVAYQEAQNDG